jgi:hypothetical protein
MLRVDLGPIEESQGYPVRDPVTELLVDVVRPRDEVERATDVHNLIRSGTRGMPRQPASQLEALEGPVEVREERVRVPPAVLHDHQPEPGGWVALSPLGQVVGDGLGLVQSQALERVADWRRRAELRAFETCRQTLHYVRESGLTAADVEQILEHNAQAILDSPH